MNITNTPATANVPAVAYKANAADLQRFTFGDHFENATITIDGVVWFKAADIATSLGYKNTAEAVRDHVSQQNKQSVSLGLRGKPPVFINEAGLYELVLSSKKPEAREFKAWVTDTVLPAINHHGGYLYGMERLAEPERQEVEALLSAEQLRRAAHYEDKEARRDALQDMNRSRPSRSASKLRGRRASSGYLRLRKGMPLMLGEREALEYYPWGRKALKGEFTIQRYDLPFPGVTL